GARGMKIGLMSVTYTGSFYTGPALSIEETIRKTAELGFDGLELVGREPHAGPMLLDREARTRIRRTAAAEGVELAAIGAQTDFSFADARLREWCLLHLVELIRLASDLGVPIVRVFAAGFGNMRTDAPELQQWHWAREALARASAAAADAGVTLALQNHAPIMQ